MAKKSSASSRQEVPHQVKNEDIMLDNKVKEELRALKGREIDTSDIPEITDWRNAVIGKFYRPIKKQVTLRLDADMLEWFKSQVDRSKGDKYQTKINKVLREYMASRQNR